ncbi:hypothetical protein ES332_D05G303000v1 [Gossypium tomentosum]|uniref:Uncharacterized protein n=1 Tax=Gossypium tomentosum TaxID=34277 RepID=A0A5D2L180_GOSTO|nr:hypothetical protein ES332_D05G303000v1 [Gossypium tomentosum]
MNVKIKYKIIKIYCPVSFLISFLSPFLLIFFFSPFSSLNPRQDLAYTILIDPFFGLKVAPNCCSPFPLLNAPIRFLGKFPKSHKNAFNF